MLKMRIAFSPSSIAGLIFQAVNISVYKTAMAVQPKMLWLYGQGKRPLRLPVFYAQIVHFRERK